MVFAIDCSEGQHRCCNGHSIPDLTMYSEALTCKLLVFFALQKASFSAELFSF